MKSILQWCLLGALSMFGSPALADDFSGTWSGSFDIHYANGRVENDSAWLVLQQSGTGVTGTAGPDADKQAPIRDVAVAGNTLRFVTDSTQGKTLQFVLTRDANSLTGEANGDIQNDHVRVVVSTTRRTATAATAVPAPDPLYQKMLALDTAAFDAFNRCSDPAQLAKHIAFFAKDVEFYHDHDGLQVGTSKMADSMRQHVCGQFRRELDTATFRAFPLPGYGAITTGTHRFCHTPTTCEGAGEFAIVWREKDGQWQITRALSYAHRAL